MNIASGLAIYFICWWITLLSVLPIGVRTQGEAGEVVPGSAESAPVNPYIRRKLILTSILSFLPWGIIIAVMEYNIFSFDDFSFIPNFSND